MSSFKIDDYKDQNQVDLILQIQELKNQIKQEIDQASHFKSKYSLEKDKFNQQLLYNHQLLLRMSKYEKQTQLLKKKIFWKMEHFANYFIKPIIGYLLKG